jgi:hypothetical protein
MLPHTSATCIQPTYRIELRRAAPLRDLRHLSLSDSHTNGIVTDT